jgi:ABC-type multidrug transport system permease subunit
MRRKNNTLKGIIIGLLLCTVLEVTDILVFAFLIDEGILHLRGWVGVLTYYSPLIAIFIISASVGMAVARRSGDYKKLSAFISVVMALILGSNYFFFYWWWHHNLQMYISRDTSSSTQTREMQTPAERY